MCVRTSVSANVCARMHLSVSVLMRVCKPHTVRVLNPLQGLEKTLRSEVAAPR